MGPACLVLWVAMFHFREAGYRIVDDGVLN
jgi:hypothetical protein